MIVLTMVIGGIGFIAVRSIVVDDYTQTRGGSGGRFVDFTHIPVVGVSETHEAFGNMYEAKVLTKQWVTYYNTIRPHSSLGGKPPAPQTIIPLKAS